LIRPFEEKYPNLEISMQGFALVYAFMGDEANTVKWLERSADHREWAALKYRYSSGVPADAQIDPVPRVGTANGPSVGGACSNAHKESKTIC
jgi:hypothetical protein